jgi:uncharacterized protein YecE (DUF72 family)
MEVLVGTSGWQYKDWGNRFYPDSLRHDDLLAYYAERFATVEVNATFYRLPSESAVKNWYKSVPDNFVYSIKLSRYITHILRLDSGRQTEEALDHFVSRIKHLKEKLGPLLVQLPSTFHASPGRIENLAKEIAPLEKKYDIPLKLACEFRHKSWFTGDIFSLLKKHNIAAVSASGPGRWPETKQVTADFAYIRFHGDQKLYASSYSDNELDAWAKYINETCKECRTVYCYFNNDQSAKAADNANYLASKFK